MDINRVGNGNYYITLGSDELQTADLTELVQKNIPIFSRNTILETYTGEQETLIFVRISRGSPLLFVFPDFETVLTAAKLCNDDNTSFLTFESSKYKLLYYPWQNEPAPAALYEFCTEVHKTHTDYELHLAEQGALLLGPFATEQLKNIFI